MKLGIKREKFGDIIVTDFGADIILFSDISKILVEDLKQLTRFRKSEITIESINDIWYLKIEDLWNFLDKKISKKDNLIVLDKETFNYYKKSFLSEYSVRYSNTLSETYNFYIKGFSDFRECISSINDDYNN